MYLVVVEKLDEGLEHGALKRTVLDKLEQRPWRQVTLWDRRILD